MVSYLYIVCTDLAALTEGHKLFSLAFKGFVFVVQLFRRFISKLCDTCVHIFVHVAGSVVVVEELDG